MVSTTHYVTKCAKMMSRAPISARKAEAAGMQHLGAVARRRPGPRDTARSQQAGWRALPSEISRHQHRRRRCRRILFPGRRFFRDYGRAGSSHCPKTCPRTSIWARTASAAGMQHLGGAVRRRPGPRDTIWVQLCSGWGLPGEIRCHRQSIMAVHLLTGPLPPHV